ncbi:MAG: site-specific DNA-methyltransferase [Nanoarchaeota archaeon]|nr:site-specific DNA-methyltransferase [Nanoarchaeota archaeon]
MNFDQKLKEKLKQNMEFWDEEINDINRNEIIDRAYKVDKDLIGILIDDKEIRETFFDKIKEYWVFNVNKFVDYIENIKVLSNSYTKFKNSVGLNVNGKSLNERGEVSLVWPFKDCVLEGGMTKEDQKRNEIFFNEILAKDEIDRLFDSKVLTNFKKYTAKGEEQVKDFNRDGKGTIKDNLIIKGNNLLALHSLKKEFAGKVKLIYIDPPYNTGGSAETFTYNNSFNHSTWLTFMKNRLEVAKDFLRDDGFISIAIDHEELLYLGVLADEVFGRENRVGIVSILHNPEGRQNAKYFTATHEYLIVYRKSISSEFNPVYLQENSKDSKEINDVYDKRDEKGIYKEENFIRLGGGDACLRKNKLAGWYPLYVSEDLRDISGNKKQGYKEIYPITDSGQERTWKIIKKSFEDKFKDGDIYATKKNGKIRICEKYRIDKGSPITTCWINKKYNAKKSGTNLLQSLFDEKLFSYPKSLYAVLDTLKIMTSNNDVVMDFFAGSGTTGHATLELNKEDGEKRQFILIEQLDTHADVIKKRIKKVLENDKSKESFTYCELLKYNEEAIDKIQDAKDTKTLLKIWDEMCEKYFLNYDVEIKKFNDNKKDFEKMTLKQQKEVLVEMLNKNQLYVNLSEVEDSQFKISKEDKELNKKFYRGK